MNTLKAIKQRLSNLVPRSKTIRRSMGVLVFSASLWISVVIFAPSWANANLPVIDVSAIGQMVQQSMQLARQLEAALQQIALLKQQVNSLTGHYGMGQIGGMVNGWKATSWADIANMVGQGINPGDAVQVQAYKAAQARYATQFPMLSGNLQTTNPRMNAAYSHTYSDAMTGTGLSEGTFNQVNTYLFDIEMLKDRIETTDNLKGAVDLNTAVNVRVAQMNGEILRMQAVQLRMQASNQTQAANGNAAQVEFFAQ